MINSTVDDGQCQGTSAETVETPLLRHLDGHRVKQRRMKCPKCRTRHDVHEWGVKPVEVDGERKALMGLDCDHCGHSWTYLRDWKPEKKKRAAAVSQ